MKTQLVQRLAVAFALLAPTTALAAAPTPGTTSKVTHKKMAGKHKAPKQIAKGKLAPATPTPSPTPTPAPTPKPVQPPVAK